MVNPRDIAGEHRRIGLAGFVSMYILVKWKRSSRWTKQETSQYFFATNQSVALLLMGYLDADGYHDADGVSCCR